jgi:pimeloyl-ACP methyl ester carboxylesterase
VHTADIPHPAIAQILEYLIDDPTVNARIPLAATAALAGDAGPLGPIVSRYEVRRAANQRVRFVDYDAVSCSDFASGTPIGRRQVCDALGVPYASDVAAPVTTNRPALLLSGSYDARTPPSLAEAASQTLPNSYREVFPATGHGIYQFPQAAACAAVVVSSFLQNPTVQPDDQCVSHVQRPRWVIPGVSE